MSSSKKPRALEFVKLNKFLDTHHRETEWILEEVLPAGGLSLWAGKPKAGKSTLVRELIVAVSKGESFLGLKTRKGKVLYLAHEELESELQKHFRQLGAVGTEDIAIYCARAPQDTVDQLAKIAASERPHLIVIDPVLRAVRVRDSNEYSAVSEMFEGLLEIARESDAHVLCVHHAGKGDRQGADAILGSTAFHGAGDASVIISRAGDSVRIESYQRYGKGIPPTSLKFDQSRRGFSVGGSPEEFAETKAINALIELLENSPEPLTQADIFDLCGIRKADAVKALARAVSNGQVKKLGEGGKGDPFRYAIQVPSIGREQEPGSSEVSR